MGFLANYSDHLLILSKAAKHSLNLGKFEILLTSCLVGFLAIIRAQFGKHVIKKWSSVGKTFERREGGIVAKKEKGSRSEGYRKIMYLQGSGRQIEVIKEMRIMGSQSRGVRT
jgi:hypothetical protein